MLTRGPQAAPSRPDKALDDLIGQIADSETFRAAPVMRSLLLYLWKHQGEPISEYAIAVDALGRSPDFDPKADSTVRVQVARLRTKLKDFYQSAGDAYPLRVSIPVGRHDLTYTYTPPVRPAKLSGLRPMPSLLLWVGGGLIALLSISTALLFWQNRALKASAPAPFPRLWQTFASNGKPSLVVVPSPLYFFWPDHRVYVRDLSISAFPKWSESELLRELGQKWGAPELAQTYVGAMEMSSGVRFLQYLDKQPSGAQLVESRKFSTDAFADRNIVFLGMPRTTAGYLDRLLEKTTFYMAEADPDVIRSRAEAPAQPSTEFREMSYSNDRRVYPAVIVFLPRRAEGTRCILVLGRYLTGAASMLLTADGLQTLEAEREKAGSPDAWEMVVEAETYRDTLLNVRARAFRPLPASFWDGL